MINWFSNGKLVFKWVNVYRYVAELALLNARVKGYESKINHCRTVLAERERELEMAEGALDSHRENAEEVARDFENRDELASAELDNMRGGAVYNLNPVEPIALENAWLQPLNMKCVSWFPGSNS